MLIAQARTLISYARVRIQLQVDEHVAICQPRRLEARQARNHLAQLIARFLEAPGVPVRARQVHTRLPEIRNHAEQLFKDQN